VRNGYRLSYSITVIVICQTGGIAGLVSGEVGVRPITVEKPVGVLNTVSSHALLTSLMGIAINHAISPK